MATASRDRLIHVFDVKDDYQFLRTLDEHSAAITSVKFACTCVCVCVCVCACVCISLRLEEVIRLQLSLSPPCVQLGKTTTFNSSAAVQTNPSSSETLKMCVPLYAHSSKVYCVILLFSLVLPLYTAPLWSLSSHPCSRPVVAPPTSNSPVTLQAKRHCLTW